jgi:CRP-like cAMP-binding protein
MTEFLDRIQNQLLSALPDVEFRRLAPQLDRVELHQGQVLYESGNTISYAYFPTTALVSTVYELEDGALTETAVVGKEGMVGIAVFMGGDSRLGRAVVLSGGHALRLRALALKDEFRRSDTLMHLLLRYTQALITQIAQTAACNRHHSLDQRLCRWLMLSLDRAHGDVVVMTQDVIANMLGVRREGVTAAAQRLQQHGLIRCARGRIAVLNRSGLEQRACECYAVVRNEYERLLPYTVATKEPGASKPRWIARPVPAAVFASERTTVAQPSSVLSGRFG